MLTALACRENATADRSGADAALLDNQAARLKTSAAAWEKRAEMLEHIERLSAARREREIVG